MIPKHLTPAPYQIKWRLLDGDGRKRQHMSLAVDTVTSRVHISCPNNVAMPKQKALQLANILVGAVPLVSVWLCDGLPAL